MKIIREAKQHDETKMLKNLKNIMTYDEDSPFVSKQAIIRDGAEEDYEYDYPEALRGKYDPKIVANGVEGYVMGGDGLDSYRIDLVHGEDIPGDKYFGKIFYKLSGFGFYDDIYDMFDDIMDGVVARTVI